MGVTTFSEPIQSRRRSYAVKYTTVAGTAITKVGTRPRHRAPAPSEETIFTAALCVGGGRRGGRG